MRAKTLHYWGDIDTHGFLMLDRLRRIFPHVNSLLMDRETFLAHRNLWTHEAVSYGEPLGRLTHAEGSFYDDLREGNFGFGARLEQERIGFACVVSAVAGKRAT